MEVTRHLSYHAETGCWAGGFIPNMSLPTVSSDGRPICEGCTTAADNVYQPAEDVWLCRGCCEKAGYRDPITDKPVAPTLVPILGEKFSESERAAIARFLELAMEFVEFDS